MAARLLTQSERCARMGSPLYADLLARATGDLRAGGAVWAAMQGLDAPRGSSPGLRFMAAVHRLVLEGRAPNLARCYPSTGGEGGPDATWDAFHQTLEQHVAEVRDLVELPCQTNEPTRSAALLGGFLAVARDTGLPLRILEIGASAGLNLRWDQYRYEAGDSGWGDPASPVRFAGVFEGPLPPLGVAAEVVERRGCDRSPVDPTSEDGRLTLMCHVWADQRERLELLASAIDIAGQVPAVVERADAAGWLEAELQPRVGAATVVFHSIVFQYLGEEGRRRVRAAIEVAGGDATRDAPMAWLRMEPADEQGAAVTLTTWPGEKERLIARAGYHGRPVWWQDPRTHSDRGPPEPYHWPLP